MSKLQVKREKEYIEALFILKRVAWILWNMTERNVLEEPAALFFRVEISSKLRTSHSRSLLML
jgi:hypothetical protein